MNTKNLMFIMLGVGCGVLVIIIISLAAQAEDGPSYCPADYVAQPPLILVSLDGFRASYLDRGLTPTIQRLIEEGASAPFMLPVFPTVTLPNHYTIVTGLYPESHGIVANSFYDPNLGKFISKSKNSSWWGGVPIWNTVIQQDLKSASFMWVGSDSEIDGERPTYWKEYNSTIPFEDRVDQVLEWVKMAPEERPAWISVYFSEPDHTGHAEGPDSDSINEKLGAMDGIVKLLVTGLEEADLLNCVNLIIVSDHGMAAGGSSWTITLSEYIEAADVARNYTGSFSMISLVNTSDEVKTSVMEKLSCQRPDMRVFEKEGLPKRLHYSSSDRIEDIVFDLDPGRTTELVKDGIHRKGNHGYDNYFPLMNALFVARGPGFKAGSVTRPFRNLELYHVMCHLTGIPPEPNNGTVGSLNDILVDPVPMDDLPEMERPTVATYPDEKEIVNRLSLSDCPGDVTSTEDWMAALDNTEEEQNALETKHAPWGLPQLLDEDEKLLLLHQPDYVTGYSTSRKTPSWVSFTLRGAPDGTPQTNWTSDVRLTRNSSPTCAQFDSLSDAIMAPLFYPGFSSNGSLEEIPYMVSNAVASTKEQQKHWQDLMGRVIMRWLGGGNLNLVVGPVYDLNFDSNADPLSDAKNYPVRPSDLFAIVMRCAEGANLARCEQHHLEVRSFIFPTAELVDNCIENEEYARKFSSTLSDVRVATNLVFFPSLDTTQRIRLETSIHQTLWP